MSVCKRLIMKTLIDPNMLITNRVAFYRGENPSGAEVCYCPRCGQDFNRIKITVVYNKSASSYVINRAAYTTLRDYLRK